MDLPGAWSHADLILITPIISGCVVLGMSLTFQGVCFFLFKVGLMMVPTYEAYHTFSTVPP